MKYAILTYSHRPMRPGSKNMLNLGDPIQCYAMRYLFGRMGVRDSDLVEISRYHTKDYAGEEVILPFNAFNMIYNQFGHPYGTLPVSPKITPVFISFHLHTRRFEEEIIDNLKAHQPIGCRDEETMINMRRHGLLAYMTGCVTALLPSRSKEPKVPKTFFVDVPNSLMEHIPTALLQNAEFVHHQIPFERSSDSEFMTEEEYHRFYGMGVAQLERYREEATLIVTSRLHAAAPCMAMGIPVILVSDNFDGRFSWLDKYLPLYTPDSFQEIAWNPEAVTYEEEKKRIMDILLCQIKGYEQPGITIPLPRSEGHDRLSTDIHWLNHYNTNRHRHIYNKGYLDELAKLPIAGKGVIKYAVWGLIAQTQALINAIEDNFVDWKLEAIIDKAANGCFEGRRVLRPSEIEKLDPDIIYFILPEVAHEDARILLTRLGRRFVLVSRYRMNYTARP